MEPKIITSKERLLVGISATMSLVANTTGVLWKTFRTGDYTFTNRVSENFISLQQYPKEYFKVFNPAQEFVKWACVAVTNFDEVSKGLQCLVVPAGKYAVFHHKGTDTSIFQYIYGEWIPNSDYGLDDRPHFEVLGPQYKNNDPNAEEEIWIPIQ